MHRVDSRTYIGKPNETVTLTTKVSGGGVVAVVVNGEDIGAARTFSLPPTPGERVKFQISLMGPLGADVVVSIAVVDGGLDGDFLMCQPHNPAPVNFYTCSVGVTESIDALAEIRGLAPTPVPEFVAAGRKGKKGKKGKGKKGGGK